MSLGFVSFGGAPSMSSTQTVGDSLKISEGVARSVAMSRAIGDSITLTEGITRSATSQTRSVADVVHVAEAIGRSQSASRTAKTVLWSPAPFAGFMLGGAALGGAEAQVESSDYFELTEGIARAAGHPRAVGESLTLVESILPAPVLGPHLPGRSNPSQLFGVSHPSQTRGRTG